MNDVLILPRLQVVHANAQQTPWLVSMAVVMPAMMMVHAMARQLGLDTGGVAVLHHDGFYHAAYDNGRPFLAQRRGASSNIDRRGDYAGDSMTLADQPVAEMGLTVSLFVELHDPDVPLEDVANFLRNGRLAGGEIVQYKPPRIRRAGQVKSRPGHGYWLMDDKQKMADQSLLPEDMAEIISRHQGDLWQTAGVAGYAFLEAPTRRFGSRQSLPHCFAEPLVAPMHYRRSQPNQAPPYWRYQEDPHGIRLINDTLTFKQGNPHV